MCNIYSLDEDSIEEILADKKFFWLYVQAWLEFLSEELVLPKGP